MTWAIRIAIGVAVVWAGLHLWLDYQYPGTTIQYRITLEVETPEGLKTGSGVIQARYKLSSGFPGDQSGLRRDYGLKGDAIAVDLGARGTLFALLRIADRDGLRPNLDTTFPYELLGAWTPDMRRLQGREWIADLNRLTGRVELRGRPMPLLVRFRDLNDPLTVEAVHPTNLAARFGPGVRLIRASIEVTRDPVTTGIENRLAWLSPHTQRTIYPSGSGYPADRAPLHALIKHGDFRSLQ